MAVGCPVSSRQPARAVIGQSREPGAFRRGGALRDRHGRPAGGSAHRPVLGQPCIGLSRRLWTAGGSRPGVSTVIHFSTAAPVHSCVVVDQLVYLNHPQAYTQGASLAGPGAGVIGARSHAGPGDPSACGAIIAPGSVVERSGWWSCACDPRAITCGAQDIRSGLQRSLMTGGQRVGGPRYRPR